MEPTLSETDKLITVCFDEMHTKNKVGLDMKTGIVVGPGKKMQVIEIRSIVSSKIKTPFYFDFNCRMDKKLLNQNIFNLEQLGLKVLVAVCDQAGENQGLQKQIGVTVEHNKFENPFDPSRSI